MHYNENYSLDDIVEYLNKDIKIDYGKVQELRLSDDINTYNFGCLAKSKTDESIFKYIDDVVRLGMVDSDIVNVSPEVYVGTNNRVYYRRPALINLSEGSRSVLYPGDDRYFVSLDVVSQEAYIILNEIESDKLKAHYETGDLYSSIASNLGVSREDAKSLWVKVVYGGKACTDKGIQLYNMLEQEGFIDFVDGIVKDYESCGVIESALGRCEVEEYFDTGTVGGRHRLFNSYNQCMGSELMVRLINKIEGSKSTLGIVGDDLRLEMMIHDELVYSASSELVEDRFDTLVECLRESKDLGLSGWVDLVFLIDVKGRL